MNCCSGCAAYPAAERQFDAAIAERDLRRYRRKGPDATSRLLLTGVADRVIPGDAVLDIGSGVGVISFELLSKGAGKATLVDASSAYLQAAAQEARRREQSGRVRSIAGDFVGLANTIEPADIVTLHRVICCYPDYARLLERATEHSRRLLAFSYPRDRWVVRAWLKLENLLRRLSGNEFRTFVHSPAAMERILDRAGFRRLVRRLTLVWSVDIYLRNDAA
jgi:2-polyprenyl-3-methyl-5-hydroxy-6-metoxy-1,4-benzoquinol methylase